MPFISKPEVCRLSRNRLRHYDINFSLPYIMTALSCMTSLCRFLTLLSDGYFSQSHKLKKSISFLIIFYVCTEHIDLCVTLDYRQAITASAFAIFQMSLWFICYETLTYQTA